MNAAHPGLGIYVHWPFCKSKCPYCDFNSHVRQSLDEERWRKGLCIDLKHALSTLHKDFFRPITSVFFGGGTPSLMPPLIVEEVLSLISEKGSISDSIEVTLEANPSSVEAKKFAAYKNSGVNRVSIGVQALDDIALKFLGRAHNAAEAMAALECANETFDRISFDLIYARPGQSIEAWRHELEQALELQPSHVSLYQLEIERGTRFFEAHQRGELLMLDDEVAVQMYEDTLTLCGASGLKAYEISNLALKGHECRHNLTYWQSGDWLGIGPGAHGRIGSGVQRMAIQSWRSPEKWLNAVEKFGSGVESATLLDPSARSSETLMMGLRLDQGIPLKRFEYVVGYSLSEMVSSDSLSALIDGGFLNWSEERISATPRGRQVLNKVIQDLLI